MRTDLPIRPGWAWSSVGSVADLLRGVSYKKSDARPSPARGLLPILRANNIQAGLEFDDLVFVPQDRVSAPQLLQLGDIVVATSSGSVSVVGKAAPLERAWVGSFGAFCMCVRPHPGLTEWLGHYFQSRAYRQEVSRRAAGVNINNLRRAHIDTLRLPVPPAAEQWRIVAKLEQLFSELDAGVAALERAQAKLDRYRASVLKAAVEGHLTEEWRREHPPSEKGEELLKRILVERRRRWEEEQLAAFEAKGRKPPKGWRDKYEEPVAPDTTGLPDLPKGWCWVGLDQLGELGRGKSKHRPRGDPALFGGPYPFIQTGEVRASGGWIREHRATYNERGLHQSRLWPSGTICITIAANIAETGILTFDACFPDSVVGLVCAIQDITRFTELFLRTSKAELDRFAPATAQKNINLETLSGLAVPLPPIAEQHEVVRLVDALLSAADAASSGALKSRTRASHLRQSILSAAFQGRLVPQDPNDEPASVLLERIRSERAAAGKDSKPKMRRRRNNAGG